MCIIIYRLSWWAKLYLLISPNESFDKCHKFRYIFLICTCIYSSNITNCDDYIIWGMWETYLTLILYWLEESIRIGSSEIVFHCSSEIVTLYLNRKDVKFLHMFISLHKFQMHTKIDFILIFFFPLMSFVTYVCHFPIRINGHTSLFQTKFLMTYRIRPSLIYVVTSHTNVSYISPVDLLFGALRGEKRALFHLSLYL